MGNYTISIDAVSVASGGGTETGSSVNVDDYKTIAVQVEGDAESANFDLEMQGQNGGQATNSFGDLDTTNNTGEDITANTNQSKIYLYDVAGLSEVRPKIINNHDAATTMTVSIGVNTNE